MPKATKPTPGIYPRETKRGIVYDAVVQVNGRQKWQRGFRTKALAVAARDEMRHEMRTGQLGGAPVRLTVGEYIEKRWWPWQEIRMDRPESRRAYKQQLKHVIKHLGEARLASLKRLDIEAFKTNMRRAGVGPAMQNAAYDRLRQALNQAVIWELIMRNPCHLVEAPKEAKHERPILAVETVQQLLAAADETPFGTLVYMAVMTGMRWGELTSLRWADVDFNEKVLRLPKAKTEAGIRAIALAEETIERLRTHRLEQMRHFTEAGGAPPQLVFTNTIGTQLAEPNFTKRWWWPLRDKLGRPELHFHDLRHVQATLMARAGVHPRVMQARLGHASSAITMEVYTHVSAEDQRPAAEAVAQLLRRPR